MGRDTSPGVLQGLLRYNKKLLETVLKATCTKGVAMSGPSSREPALIRNFHCPELMRRMMERVGVAPVEAVRVDGGLAWLEARTKCIFCRHAGECRSWLEEAKTPSATAVFCANSKFFDSWAEQSATDTDALFDIELLPWRLQQLGLDPEYVKVCYSSTYQNLEKACATCRSRALCERDLARGDVDSGMQRYCPSALTMDALAVNWVP
jgi:hypothetical protein